MPVEVPCDLPSLLLHTLGDYQGADRWEYSACVQGRGRVRWPSTVWPAALDSYFAWGVFELADNLDWYEARWATRRFLEPLFDADTPLSALGALLIALALAAKEPGEHGLAVDAAIETLGDGRLDAERLGTALAFLLPTRLAKPGRWAKRLAEVAGAGALHAEVVQRGLEAAITHDPCLDPKSLPRDFSKLLELYHQLLAAAGEIASKGVRTFLRRYRGSSKAAKIARQVLAREASPDPTRSRTVLVEALAGRVERAERWRDARKAGRR